MHKAINVGNPAVVEVLLNKYHANPNLISPENETTLMCSVTRTSSSTLSMIKLLANYGFDFSKLVNHRLDRFGSTVFHALCTKNCVNTQDQIECIKYLFDICQKTPHCSINILAQDEMNMCGLHYAIGESNVELVKYLVENVYFPNNDKKNTNGIAFLKIKLWGKVPLSHSIAGGLDKNADSNNKCKIFKLLFSYGMNVCSTDTSLITHMMRNKQTEIVEFLLNKKLCPIYTCDDIVRLMCMYHGMTPNTRILQAFYNYGLKHGIIFDIVNHQSLLFTSATINLPTFKAVFSMILAHHGINDLKRFKQCQVTQVVAMEYAALLSATKQSVKLFIEGLLTDDTELVQSDKATCLQVSLTCTNGHEMKTCDDNKINNYGRMCLVCNDNNNGGQLLNGYKCDICKSFLCDDCVIVQTINKKMDMIGDETVQLYYYTSKEYEMSIFREILQHTNNEKLFGKVE